MFRLEIFTWERVRRGNYFRRENTMQKILGMGKYDEGVRFTMEKYSG